MKKAVSQLISIILVAVIAFACGFGGSIVKDYLVKNEILNLPFLEEAETPQPAELPPAKETEEPQPGNMTINVTQDVTIAEAIAAKVLPSVVGVSTTYEVTYGGYDFFGWGGGGYSYDVEGVGTGFVVDKAGYILTNSHVVNDGDTKSINVSLYDGETVPAIILWNNSTLDLAIIKIEGVDDLVEAELGDSDEINVGSYAAAIGNPLGLAFERSMSQGIISGLNRSIDVQNESGSTSSMEGLIQTDATINNGNSGGPLLNSHGQVVGINTAKAGNGEGMGFAIPINTAKPIIEQIIKTGAYNRPYIGITGIGLDEQTSYNDAQLQEYFGTTTGVYVYSVTEGGGAERAGIQKGDIIVEVEGIPVGTMNKLNTVLVTYNPGDTVRIKVLREGEEMTFNVHLTGEVREVF